MKSETNERPSACIPYKIFDKFADEDDFIEMTEWVSGLGYDVTINNKKNGNRIFPITIEELEAIRILESMLIYRFTVTKEND